MARRTPFSKSRSVHRRMVRAAAVLAFVFATLLSLTTSAVSETIYNGNFEADGGSFLIPTGWTPFGEAKYEALHDGSWKAQLADVPPRHEAGLYQAVRRVTPGMRYRLTARAKTGNPQLPISVGIIPKPTVNLSEAAWSEEYAGGEWTTLEAEAVAESSILLVLLRMRNANEEHTFFESSVWDDVTLTAVSKETVPRTSRPVKKPVIPPATDVYASLANLWSLAWPKSGVRTFLASSHDPDPEANADFDRAEGSTEINGESWTVLKSIEGPGAIVRIWMTNFAKDGRIRIEADGETVEESGLYDFFGTPGLFHWPLANKTSGAWMSYVPIPFAKSARVLVKDVEGGRFYWQVTYQTFRSDKQLRPFTNPLNRTDQAHMQAVRDQWGLAGTNPKPPWPNSRETSGRMSLNPGETERVWAQTGAGMVDALWIDVPGDDAKTLQGLRLRCSWDRAPSLQVDVPLGLFLGAGYDRKVVRGLLMGITPEGGYCYFPMPYRTVARIELMNTTDSRIADIRYRVRWVPLAENEVSRMRFHAVEKRDSRAGEGGLFVPLEVRGRGHFVGISAAMAKGSADDIHFLEGDEYIWVDGEANPSTAGTGTEDYFTCGWYFSQGPITLAPIGCPEIDHDLKRVSAYRLHVPDWVPFERSLKFGLEVGNATHSAEWGDYRAVSYYYLEAD